MQIHILIPNFYYYPIVIMTMLILGSFPIARHCHLRLCRSQFSLMATSAIIKMMIVLLGLLFIPIQTLFVYEFKKESMAVLLGVCFGYLVIVFETEIVKIINRKRVRMQSFIQNENDFLRNTKLKSTLILASKKIIRARGMQYVRQSYVDHAVKPDFFNYSIFAVILVAIAEEILFRGYLLWITDQTVVIFIFALVINIFVFAFSHVSSAWHEFFRKLPLGFLTVCSVLMTQSILSAIITHVIFNLFAYRKAQQMLKSQPLISG